jgi:hypothetical protein
MLAPVRRGNFIHAAGSSTRTIFLVGLGAAAVAVAATLLVLTSAALHATGNHCRCAPGPGATRAGSPVLCATPVLYTMVFRVRTGAWRCSHCRYHGDAWWSAITGQALHGARCPHVSLPVAARPLIAPKPPPIK